MDIVVLLKKFERAFSWRAVPMHAVEAQHQDTDIYEDAAKFNGRKWQSLTCDEIEDSPAATSGFSPEAFCYYLPGICSAGIRESRPDLLANTSLIYMLDRSNTPSSWDSFFLERWPSLTRDEFLAVQAWILWLSESVPQEFSDSEVSRAFDTIGVLLSAGGATPIARGRRGGKP